MQSFFGNLSLLSLCSFSSSWAFMVRIRWKRTRKTRTNSRQLQSTGVPQLRYARASFCGLKFSTGACAAIVLRSFFSFKNFASTIYANWEKKLLTAASLRHWQRQKEISDIIQDEHPWLIKNCQLNRGSRPTRRQTRKWMQFPRFFRFGKMNNRQWIFFCSLQVNHKFVIITTHKFSEDTVLF